jgi:hypothetical protein
MKRLTVNLYSATRNVRQPGEAGVGGQLNTYDMDNRLHFAPRRAETRETDVVEGELAEAASIACSASAGGLAAIGLEFGRQPAIHRRAIEHRRDLLRLIAGEAAPDRRDLEFEVGPGAGEVQERGDMLADRFEGHGQKTRDLRRDRMT